VDRQWEFGLVGLGKMGGSLALQALEKGMKVVGFTQRGASAELLAAGLTEAASLGDFDSELAHPRSVLVFIPAGPAVDDLLDQLAGVLQPGDLIVDGGNSYWGDSVRRYARLRERGIHFVDLGTSGGVSGARHGACFMAGGEREAVARLGPLLVELAVPAGFVHAGPPGSGHFVKLVHNGIEFGMLQAIGEGVHLLQRYHDTLDIPGVLRCWRNGSVIRSWLIDLMEESYRMGNGLDAIPPYVEDTGEVNWLVSDALRMEVPVPVIAQAVMQLFASRDDERLWARAIAMMRHGFGGHPYGPDDGIRRERHEGRIGDFPADHLPQDQS
jgi:6-phosphogluconate dehydrogenase